MQTLRTVIGIAWLAFWAGWLVAATSAKRSTGRRRSLRFNGLSAIAVIVLLRFLGHGSVVVRSPVLGAIGAAMMFCGLGVAIWARVVLGRNWGMPMTQKDEPELVTRGPYASVRHPIYSGLLLAFLGTALATSLYGLIIAVVLGGSFVYAATVEERNLAATFPGAYPKYRATTKMLIPFLL
ncbi:MAG: methyltransferase family protein [Solirubrobacteraceae bacterium]